MQCPFIYLHLLRNVPYFYDTLVGPISTLVAELVSIHNLRTISPRYGELLALLVYLTWLLHVGLGFETCLIPLFFG